MGKKKGAERYKSSHWGIGHAKTYDIHVPGLRRDHPLVEMGKLVELQLDGALTIKFGTSPLCILAFATTPDERLYILMPESWKKNTKRRLINPRESWYTLQDIAEDAGGRQANYPYSSYNPQVQLLGTMENVVYSTHKKGDGPSEYIHKMGEEGGIKPYLTIDRDGNLWIAGGSYKVPDPGITN